MSSLFKPFIKRIVSVCAVAVLMAACASAPQKTTQPNLSYSSKSNGSHKDIWQRVRNGYRMPDLYNDEVIKKEAYYAQRAEYMIRMANRSGDFLYLIMNEVERRNMPSELALLPFVESAFVTTAQSSVKAAGLWQFMPATGKDFSLQQNHFADQRNNVIASTNAALTYLQQLYNMFGDWHLALAAYNWGQGNVSKAVRRARSSGYQGTYEDIKMPLETRQYVPKLQAIKNIVKNPAQFGLVLPTITNSARHEAVAVTRDIDVDVAARLSGMSVADFKNINPGFKKSVIAASLGSQLLVPTEHAERVRQALRNESEIISTLTTHSTYQIESLADIAARYKTNEDKLRQLNNIPYSHSYVNSGSALLVPRTSNKKDQDIPFSALIAGLSTNAGSAGLMDGDYIEQPIFTAQNNTSFNGDITLTNNLNNMNQGDDQLGLIIKNNHQTNDPVRGQNAVVVGQHKSTSHTNQNISQPLDSSIVLQKIEPSNILTPINTITTPVATTIITTSNIAPTLANNTMNIPTPPTSPFENSGRAENILEPAIISTSLQMTPVLSVDDSAINSSRINPSTLTGLTAVAVATNVENQKPVNKTASKTSAPTKTVDVKSKATSSTKVNKTNAKKAALKESIVKKSTQMSNKKVNTPASKTSTLSKKEVKSSDNTKQSKGKQTASKTNGKTTTKPTSKVTTVKSSDKKITKTTASKTKESSKKSVKK